MQRRLWRLLVKLCQPSACTADCNCWSLMSVTPSPAVLRHPQTPQFLLESGRQVRKASEDCNWYVRILDMFLGGARHVRLASQLGAACKSVRTVRKVSQGNCGRAPPLGCLAGCSKLHSGRQGGWSDSDSKSGRHVRNIGLLQPTISSLTLCETARRSPLSPPSALIQSQTNRSDSPTSSSPWTPLHC